MKRRLKLPEIAAPAADEAPRPLLVRLLWMLAIWAVSIAALLAVAGVLRLVLRQ